MTMTRPNRLRRGSARALCATVAAVVALVLGVPQAQASAGATRHTARVSVTMRLWGPGPVKAELQSWHDPSGLWNAKPGKAAIGVRGFASQRMVYPTADADFPDQADGDGFLGGAYPAGRYAELTLRLSVTTSRP